MSGSPDACTIRSAAIADAPAIAAVLYANADDSSLFQQSEVRIRADIPKFLVAADLEGRVLGCIELNEIAGTIELLAVAVSPDAQRRNIGTALVRAAIARARECRPRIVWLGTKKASWFARLGFVPMSR